MPWKSKTLGVRSWAAPGKTYPIEWSTGLFLEPPSKEHQKLLKADPHNYEYINPPTPPGAEGKKED